MSFIDRAGKTLDFLRFRRRDYQLVFGGADPAKERVLADLAQFCRAHTSCFSADPRLHAVAEGRREVWLRIANHLHLTSEQLYRLYGGPQALIGDEDNG